MKKPIAHIAIKERMNRKLAKIGQQFHKARRHSPVDQAIGAFYITDNDGVVESFSCLAELCERYALLKGYEELKD